MPTTLMKIYEIFITKFSFLLQKAHRTSSLSMRWIFMSNDIRHTTYTSI